MSFSSPAWPELAQVLLDGERVAEHHDEADHAEHRRSREREDHEHRPKLVQQVTETTLSTPATKSAADHLTTRTPCRYIGGPWRIRRPCEQS